MTVAERRKFPRLAIGGNAEITSILGRDDLPEGRSTILNCSRGGALIRVPSPQRRLFKKRAPVVESQDSITVVLRFPPVYQDIEVFAEVRRVVRPDSDPESLYVGIRFFYDVQRKSGLDRHLNILRRLLGSAHWCDSSANNKEVAAKLPGNAPVRGSSKRTKKISASKRLKATNGNGSSKRVKAEAGTSKRLKKEANETKKSKRLRAELNETKKSKRLKREANETKSKRLKKEGGRSTSKRLSADPGRKGSKRVKKQTDVAKRDAGPRSDSSTVRRLTIKRANGSSSTRHRLPPATPRPTIPPRPTSGVLWERSSAILDSALFVPEAFQKPKPKPKLTSKPTSKPTSLPDPRPLPEPIAPPPLGLASSVTAPARPERARPTPTEPDLDPVDPLEQPPPAPTPTMAPVYFGLAGPESGLYIRGRGRLCEGLAVIDLPAHFSQTVDPRTMTVHLTPNGECFGLFVAERLPTRITIRELGGGTSKASFDYMVLGRRR